jgi:putative Holliday junction resolvase
MARILAIDYGTKRTGIAVTDETQTFAFGLETVRTADLFPFLDAYMRKEEVVAIVVGEPKRMNNTATDATVPIRAFIRQFEKKYSGIPVHRMDERFTSSIAKQSILASGVKKKGRADKTLVDLVSAVIILQSWLEQRELKSGR